jgi:TonB-dependent starch-binding outer membrane protein SusC
MRKNLLLKMVPLLLLISSMAWAQERTVTGKVTAAEDGTGLPGVNVVVKGTTIGTITDTNGEYTINASGGVLVFSFIGLKDQEVEIGSRSVIDVTMVADITQLSEVIVVGYGTQDKRTLTGSISSVKGEVFKNLPVQSLDRGIQGRMAGVQISSASGAPGGALNVRIRGTGSINSSNDPLWIVDGVQLGRFGQTTQGSSNPLASINPNDIESVEVLKDAASAAIYGAQAANGVVLVTTKKGKKGKSNLEVSAQLGVVQPLNLYKMLNGRQFAELKAESVLNAIPASATPQERTAAINAGYTRFGNPNDANLTNYDWVDAMFQTGQLSTYDASLSGGDDKTTFLVSLSYQKQEGQIIKSDWQRGTARLNLTHKPNSKLTLGTNLSIAYQRAFGAISNGNFVNSPFVAAFSAQPTSSPFLSDGRTFAPYPASGAPHLFNYNILQGVNEEVRLGRVPQTVSSFSLAYEVIPGLTINGFAGVDASFGTDNNQRPGTIPAFPGGQMSVTSRRTINYNTNITLNYSKRFAKIHSVSGLLGFEYRKEERGGVTASQFLFPNPALRLLTSGATSRPATEFFFDNARQGIFGQVKYTLKDRYIIDGTLRRDGSSRFGENNRYGIFYAGSLAYRISEESFMDAVKWLDDLKVRIAYGVVGNSEINDYDWFTSFGSPAAGSLGIPAGAGYTGQSILRLTRLGNDVIGWEREGQFNVGTDFALFGGRLTGSVEYYSNITEDLLSVINLPEDGGVATYRGNAGKIENSGFDIELGGLVLERGDFNWRIAANVSTLKNVILELPDNQQEILVSNGLAGAVNVIYRKGNPIQGAYLFDFAGINPATGRAMIYDANGNIKYIPTQADMKYHGSLIPSYFGGLTNSFSYKGLSLEVFFQFQGGNKAFNPDFSNLYNSGSGNNNQLVSQLNRWQNPGDITNVGRPFEGGVIDGADQTFGNFFANGVYGSTQYMSDASYVRLKQVTLSYNLPTSLVSKASLVKASLFVQGLNLWTYTKFAGIDPEVASNNNATGISGFGVFPVGRQFMAGIP